MRVALVSCVKSKRSRPSPARELYTSQLFRGLRVVAERTADSWFILSARFGLVEPLTVLEPYELTLNRMKRAEREAWANRVVATIERRFPIVRGGELETFDVYAGERYREFIVPRLVERGHIVNVPLEGLGFGKQLQWLATYRGLPQGGAL